MHNAILIFILHRLLLLGIILFFAQGSFSSRSVELTLRNANNMLSDVGNNNLSLLQSRKALDSFKKRPNVFLIVHQLLVRSTQYNPLHLLVGMSFLSSILFLVLLSQILKTLTFPALTVSTLCFTIIMPGSFEASLGSSFYFSSSLLLLFLKMFLSAQWVASGVFLALFYLFEPEAILWIPFILSVLVGCNLLGSFKNFLLVLSKLLVPTILVVSVFSSQFLNFEKLYLDSAFYHLYRSIIINRDFIVGMDFQEVRLLFPLAVLIVGSIFALFKNDGLVSRITPMFFLLYVMFSRNYQQMFQQLVLAGLCFQGVATVLPAWPRRILMGLVFSTGVVETVRLFS